MSTLACLTSALTISTRCWIADRQFLDERVGVDVEAVAVREVGDVAARLAPVEEADPGPYPPGGRPPQTPREKSPTRCRA